MVTVTLNGNDITGRVLGDPGVRVQVGRQQVNETGDPGACSFAIASTDWVPLQYTDRVEVEDGGVVRFAGWVSDLAAGHVDDPANPGALLSYIRVTCVGPLARWGRERIGDEPWPEEPVAARAARVAAIVGDDLVVQGGGDVLILSRDVDSKPGIDVLSDLADTIGGFLYDHAGTTYLQSIDVRRLTDPQERWDDQSSTWAAFPDESWDQQTQTSATHPTTIVLGPDVVLWEPVPKQTSRIANTVTVEYGRIVVEGEQDKQYSTTSTDPVSAGIFGTQTAKIKTQLVSQGDAELRARLVLERSAYPQWHLDLVAVAFEHLDPATAAQVAAMLPGGRVQVSGLPMPGPFPVFDGCVEGWSEVWQLDTATDQVLRTITLHLSDVRWSFAVLTWDGVVPDTLTWAEVDTAWDDILTADDLEAAI